MAGVKKENRVTDRGSSTAASPVGPSDATPDSQVSTPDSQQSRPQNSLTGLWPLLLIAVWQLALLWMVWTSANPVTLNRKQIRDADWIVHVRVIDPKSGRFEVLETMKALGDFEQPQEVTVRNARDLQLSSSSEFLVPLTRLSLRSGDFEVTRTQLPGEIPLIYPWNDSAKRQLAAVLQSDR